MFYKKHLWGIFELKLHTLGTSEIYFTSCEKGIIQYHAFNDSLIQWIFTAFGM